MRRDFGANIFADVHPSISMENGRKKLHETKKSFTAVALGVGGANKQSDYFSNFQVIKY